MCARVRNVRSSMPCALVCLLCLTCVLQVPVVDIDTQDEQEQILRWKFNLEPAPRDPYFFSLTDPYADFPKNTSRPLGTKAARVGSVAVAHPDTHTHTHTHTHTCHLVHITRHRRDVLRGARNQNCHVMCSYGLLHAMLGYCHVNA